MTEQSKDTTKAQLGEHYILLGLLTVIVKGSYRSRKTYRQLHSQSRDSPAEVTAHNRLEGFLSWQLSWSQSLLGNSAASFLASLFLPGHLADLCFFQAAQQV